MSDDNKITRGVHPNSLKNLKPALGPPYNWDDPDAARKAQAKGVAQRKLNKAKREASLSFRKNVAEHLGKTEEDLVAIDYMQYFAEQAAVSDDTDTAADLYSKIAPYQSAKLQSVQTTITAKPLEDLSDEELQERMAAALAASKEDEDE